MAVCSHPLNSQDNDGFANTDDASCNNRQHTPEQQDTTKDVLLFLVQACGTHSHYQFVTHH